MTEQGEQRPLTRRELRERQMRKQQLHVETADEAAAYTSEVPIVGQSRHGQDQGTPESELTPKELERRAAIYAELEKEVQISPEDEHGNPRSRREIRTLFQEEIDRLFAEREAQRDAAAESVPAQEGDDDAEGTGEPEPSVDAVQAVATEPDVETESDVETEPVAETETVTETDTAIETEESVEPDEADHAEEQEQHDDGAEASDHSLTESEQDDDASNAAPGVEHSDEAAPDAASIVIDDLPPTEALSLDELFDESEEEPASVNNAVEEREQDPSEPVENEPEDDDVKGGWLSRLRRKKSAPVQEEAEELHGEPEAAEPVAETTEDAATEEATEDESEQQPEDNAEFTSEPETFTQLLKQSVKDESQAEAVEEITDSVEAVEADEAHVFVDGESIEVEAEEVGTETAILNEIISDEESNEDVVEDEADVDADTAAEDVFETDDEVEIDSKEESDDDSPVDDAKTAPKSAASGGYSFPNIVPLEENQPVFDNNSDRDLEQSTAGFDNLISRAVEEESSANTSGTSALILPAMPTSDGISGPIGQTGELFVSGSIELPKSLGETGGHRLSAEELGLDDEHDGEQDQYGNERGSAPVSAVSAVSARNTNYSIVSPTKKDHSRKPMIFAISGGALVLIAGGVVYWGVTNGLFG